MQRSHCNYNNNNSNRPIDNNGKNVSKYSETHQSGLVMKPSFMVLWFHILVGYRSMHCNKQDVGNELLFHFTPRGNKVKVYEGTLEGKRGESSWTCKVKKRGRGGKLLS